MSPIAITVKNDNLVKIALDSRNLNDSCIKRRPHMPNIEKLLNQISVEITRDRTAQLFMSKIDLDYAYGQMKLSKKNKPTMRIRNQRGKIQPKFLLKRTQVKPDS